MKYNFYVAKTDILFKFNDDLEITIKKGEPLLRVGYGIAHWDLPLDSISNINYIQYKQEGLIEEETDEILIEEYKKQFSFIIETLETDMTSQFLSILSTYGEFIKIPEVLKEDTLKTINKFFV